MYTAPRELDLNLESDGSAAWVQGWGRLDTTGP
jgi:hypothetical protein